MSGDGPTKEAPDVRAGARPHRSAESAPVRAEDRQAVRELLRGPTPPEAEARDQRESQDATWYIALDPATPIVAAGTMVVLRLQNSLGASFRWGSQGRPRFTLREPSGRELVLYTPTRPEEIRYQATEPGHYLARFSGRPEHVLGGLSWPGAEISVSLEFDVSRTLGPEVLASEGARRTEQADLASLQRPDAAEGEIAGAFQRLAVRLGFAVLEQNRQEAEAQLELYTKGAGGTSSAQATAELRAILGLDSALERQIERLHGEPLEASWQAAIHEGHEPRSLAEVQAYRKAREDRITCMRTALVDAFPALAVVRAGELRQAFEHRPDIAGRAVEYGLRRVLADIETTKHDLASGDLEILRVAPIVAQAQAMLKIDEDPRKQRAIEQLLRAHGIEELQHGLAVAGATIFLLFVPGIGPYLAAAAGAAWAARSWARAGELRAAAGAGVREGLVERDEAARAAFWAVVDTLAVGLDLGVAVSSTLSAAKNVIPHVPAAAQRVAGKDAELGRLVEKIATAKRLEAKAAAAAAREAAAAKAAKEAWAELGAIGLRLNDLTTVFDPGIARALFRALYHSIKRGIDSFAKLRAEAKLLDIVGDITQMSGAGRAQLEAALEEVEQLVATGTAKGMDEESLLRFVDRWAINRTRPGFQAKLAEEMKAWKPLTAEQQQALSALEQQRRLVSGLYADKTATLKELLALRAKPGKNAEDVAKIRALEEQLAWLDPKILPAAGKPPPGLGKIAEAEVDLARAEAEAARVELTLYDRLRAAVPSPKARDQALRGVIVDQVGPLKTRPTPLEPDHLVSVREISDMDGFAELPWSEQKTIADMKENLIAMDGAANRSKSARTWRSWPQASTFYDQPTIASMIEREARVRALIQAEIKQRLAKLATRR